MYFLNINKPKGLTSFDVIYKLRKILNTRQIGHSGTLDPFATGVLQIAVGSATKLLDYLDSKKTYIATLKFGYTTETFDSESDEIFVKKPDFRQEKLINVLNSFIGKTKQIPPKYSAIKINGKKLCNLARESKADEIKLIPRDIEIYEIEILEFRDYILKIKVSCKKGTYIRSLAHDIGSILGCGAYLIALERINSGGFDITNSNNLEDEKFIKINPLEVLNYSKLELSEYELAKIKNGNFIKNNSNFENNSVILLTNYNKLVSIARIEDNLIKPKRLFVENF